ncbi:50S ribosomal protein L22 [Acidimicrobiia bacterium]
MAFGAKTNERPGVRAQVKYVRSSAYKAREILDLIRGLPVARALEVLEFAERDIARTILKCLESAIANAEHNNSIPADELFVSACFADEGPTLKRWRPRARGRATRIRKRTTHVTIIVSRMSTEDLEALRAREASSGRVGGGRAAAEARRERVTKSRQAKAERQASAEHDHDHDHEGHDHEGHDHEGHDHDEEIVEVDEVEVTDAADVVIDAPEVAETESEQPESEEKDS